MLKRSWTDILWDLWCTVSIVGIWPRFIEPSYLTVSKLDIGIENLHADLNDLKILQFSDLHWHQEISKSLLKKVIAKVKKLKPDAVVFTGDFICRAVLENPEGLIQFLNGFYAPLGCYAILGNHDYEKFVTVNEKGEYDVELKSEASPIVKGFRRLFTKNKPLLKSRTREAENVKIHLRLAELIQKTPFKLLDNETVQITSKQGSINLSGISEYTTGNFNPVQAFDKFDKKLPGIVLVHNPDASEYLKEFPGDLILSGHTHGGQVNLPWIWKKLTKMENQQWKTGLFQLGNRKLYVNRGVGSVMNFRWFASPELTLVTLRQI